MEPRPKSWFWRRLLSAAFLGVTLAASALPGDMPPIGLLRENTRKSSAIVEGTITASEMPKGQLAATTLSVKKVFKGSLQPGDVVTYHSFKEQANYADQWQGKLLIVYLAKPRNEAGVREWRTATDLSEFVASDDLEKAVISLTGRKK